MREWLVEHHPIWSWEYFHPRYWFNDADTCGERRRGGWSSTNTRAKNSRFRALPPKENKYVTAFVMFHF